MRRCERHHIPIPAEGRSYGRGTEDDSKHIIFSGGHYSISRRYDDRIRAGYGVSVVKQMEQI